MRIYLLIPALMFHLLVFGGTSAKEGFLTISATTSNNTDDGFIKTKYEDETLYLGIPKVLLNQPMLLVNHQDGARLENKYVLWKRHGSSLYLQVPGTIESSSGVIIPMGTGDSIHDEIVATFKIIEAKNTTDTFWINANDLFLKPHLIGWKASEGRSTIKDQSYFKGFKYFEDELVVKVVQVNSGKQRTWIEEVDYSIFLLPKPMTSRSFDHRMGFSSADYMNFNSINFKAETPKANIARWRLVKKYKDSSISVPVEPITFVVSSNVPKKWRPYVRAGILEWLPAFEAAGFKNAIEVQDKESLDSLSYFNSVHHNLVTWGNKRNVRGFENKKGSSVYAITDLRTGEILSTTISIGSSYQSIMDEYIIRCAPLDPRARQYPLPDQLLGELIQSLVAHEAGHAFGLRDANYGEYSYPLDMLRNTQWLEKMGHTPSIMNYTRHNNIPQPSDNVPPYLLIQKVGPTDIYSIKWGYSVIEGGKEREHSFLENLVKEQDTITWYRYNITRDEVRGPSETEEVVDSDDPIQGTVLALMNMERTMALIPKINQNKKDHVLSKRLYEKTLNLWFNQMKQVMSLIGGYTIQYKSGGQKGNLFTPIPKEKQVQAIDFFINNAFTIPAWLSSPELMERIGYTNNNDKVSYKQTLLLLDLIGEYRMNRLEYMEQNKEFKGLTDELLLKLQSRLFTVHEYHKDSIDFRKVEIQAIYVDKLISAIEENSLNFRFNNTPYHYNETAKGRFRQLLNQLKISIEKNLKYSVDPMLIGHYTLLLQRMNERLGEKKTNLK